MTRPNKPPEPTPLRAGELVKLPTGHRVWKVKAISAHGYVKLHRDGPTAQASSRAVPIDRLRRVNGKPIKSRIPASRTYAVLLPDGTVTPAKDRDTADRATHDKLSAVLFRDNDTQEWLTLYGKRTVADRLARWADQLGQRR